jgi:hypothetical protein
VTPESSPVELTQVLVSQGMELEDTSLGMVVDVESVHISLDSKITVEMVSLHNVQDYAKVSCLGWEDPPSVEKEMTEDMVRSLKDSAHRTEYFIARYEGVPAASGALLPLAKSGYLLGSSVAPEFRGKGLYRALVYARLERLKELGLGLAYLPLTGF